VYRLRAEVAGELAEQCIYVEQGRSGRRGAGPRPLFERVKHDAAARRFDRLLVWKVSRLGRDMREVISTVHELADLGVTVIPVKSQTGPITSTMGRLLWAIQAWYAEMENDERSESIRAGHARARAGGKQIGRPRRVFDRQEVLRLRDQERRSWPHIARRLGVGVGTVRRAYDALTSLPQLLDNSGILIIRMRRNPSNSASLGRSQGALNWSIRLFRAIAIGMVICTGAILVPRITEREDGP
jgi:putative DNA-invertase from lambdoid prophage Rac